MHNGEISLNQGARVSTASYCSDYLKRKHELCSTYMPLSGPEGKVIEKWSKQPRQDAIWGGTRSNTYRQHRSRVTRSHRIPVASLTACLTGDVMLN